MKKDGGFPVFFYVPIRYRKKFAGEWGKAAMHAIAEKAIWGTSEACLRTRISVLAENPGSFRS